MLLAAPSLTAILDKALALEDLTPREGLFLLSLETPEELAQLQDVANQLRARLAGETVTYVVNRNINFTNICEQHCGFCAFRRDAGEDGAFWLTQETMLQKVQEAVHFGATEICLQGGLNPEAKIGGSSLQFYVDLIGALKTSFPQLHLHAFSPQEIQFIARQDGLDYRTVLTALKSAGVGSLPGTAAEVLVDEVRRVICPEKIDSQTWLEIISLAHQLGLPTTSTLLCGHIETPAQQTTHLERLREVQHRAVEENYPARITEFILLPFVGEKAPLPLKRRVGRNQPDLDATLKLTAVARLYLGRWIVNHQPSWVKLGLDGALRALTWGCNDLGGTLMEEHITTLAGARGGTGLTVNQLQEAIASLRRPSAQRTTIYSEFKADGVNGTPKPESLGRVASACRH
ncbi:MAG: 7,8-didemethyl-8-hydroxy-5-deazariboflavin synthase subunit CofH [Cyanobacteria bacterium RI_101]|nr:7,8-didemethyl-8-hydroxy-5-deazariboflavin synthase subunit CofH [Cyanobacteria bacterium RI_101]